MLRAVQIEEEELALALRLLQRLAVGAGKEARAPFPIVSLEAPHERRRRSGGVLVLARQQACAQKPPQQRRQHDASDGSDSLHTASASGVEHTHEAHRDTQAQRCGNH